MKKPLDKTMRFSQSKLFERYTELNSITLVDIGARGGIDSRWDLIKANIKVLGFEPDIEECKRLNKRSGNNHVYFPIALYNKGGTIEINIARSPATSSIYFPNFSLMDRFSNSDDLKIVKLIRVQCDALDSILKSNNIQDADFLKIDTQGSELQILEGAKNALQNFIFGVDVEVEFSPIYEEQPLFMDVDEYLRKLGFTLFDLNLARLKRKKYSDVYSRGQVFWAHALYFKDFLLNKNTHPNYLNFKKAVKTIAIAEIYGFSDFALELLDFYHQKEIIDKGVYENIRKLLIKNKLLPEYQLIKNLRFIVGNYLKERTPFIYNLIKKKL